MICRECKKTICRDDSNLYHFGRGVCSAECLTAQQQRWSRERYQALCDDRLQNTTAYLARFGVAKAFQLCRLSNYAPRSKQQREALVWLSELHRFEPWLIMLLGPAGTGKTHLAVGLMAALLPTWHVAMRFVSATDMLADTKIGFSSNEDRLARYECASMLVIDDFGVDKKTDWTFETWYKLVDGRYKNQKATVITSNLTLKDIAEKYDDRIASRLSSGKIFVINGPDGRVNS